MIKETTESSDKDYVTSWQEFQWKWYVQRNLQLVWVEPSQEKSYVNGTLMFLMVVTCVCRRERPGTNKETNKKLLGNFKYNTAEIS